MQLSEAIRLGSMLKPQATGRVSKNGGTCALGAALEAVGERTGEGWFRVYDLWPIARRHVPYPGTSTHHGKTMLVGSCCWILNDADGWTREQIAEWVASLEQSLTTDAPVPDADPAAVPSVA